MASAGIASSSPPLFVRDGSGANISPDIVFEVIFTDIRHVVLRLLPASSNARSWSHLTTTGIISPQPCTLNHLSPTPCFVAVSGSLLAGISTSIPTAEPNNCVEQVIRCAHPITRPL